jgi:hypothetical protein
MAPEAAEEEDEEEELEESFWGYSHVSSLYPQCLRRFWSTYSHICSQNCQKQRSA